MEGEGGKQGERSSLVCNGIFGAFAEVSEKRQILRDLVLELRANGSTDEERVLHLLFRGHGEKNVKR